MKEKLQSERKPPRETLENLGKVNSKKRVDKEKENFDKWNKEIITHGERVLLVSYNLYLFIVGIFVLEQTQIQKYMKHFKNI